MTGSSIVRWGLIGCGDVADRKSGPALASALGSALCAVSSRDAQRAAWFAERHGVSRHYTDWRDMLADDEIDAVYIATPPAMHAEQAIAAAEHGRHVLCEKPMAMNLPECDRMIEAARDNRVLLTIAYYRRTYPAVQKVKQLIDEGAVGTPVKVDIELMDRYGASVIHPLPWRFDPAIAGGGVLWDVGSHRIDLLIYLLGDVADVAGYADTFSLPVEVDDAATLVMRFVNGAHGVVTAHWNMPSKVDSLFIHGTSGTIDCDLLTGHVRVSQSATEQSWTLPAPQSTHGQLVEQTVEAIRGRKSNPISGTEGRKTNVVLEAVTRSQGRRNLAGHNGVVNLRNLTEGSKSHE